ncbi:hypothetical protein BQ8482_190103 [Mesorhizobium delmotii]|uniref:Uncharacterized protein n=1 Tax=Mesorhizobium delmotii TaxID=1631247 RepID=A0A2P9AJU7_9HYPH|nr:hypothetical protein BQ8482_190103 [Mesorhizobium delmotii]
MPNTAMRPMRATSGSRRKRPSHETLRNRLATMSSGSSNGQPRSTVIETRVASRLRARRPARLRSLVEVGRCVIGPSCSGGITRTSQIYRTGPKIGCEGLKVLDARHSKHINKHGEGEAVPENVNDTASIIVRI